MKFPRNSKILRSQFDMAPFAAVFFIIVIFVMLGTLMARGGLELVPKLRSGPPLRTRRRNLTLGPESAISVIKRGDSMVGIH